MAEMAFLATGLASTGASGTLLFSSAGAAAAFSALPSLATVASVGLTAASAFGDVQSGNLQGEALLLQSRQAGLNARTERLEGRREALKIQKDLDKNLASQNAIFAARGILEGEGTAKAAKDEAQRNATKDIDLARFNSEINASNAKTRAAISEADASAAKKQGKVNAISTIAKTAIPLIEDL